MAWGLVNHKDNFTFCEIGPTPVAAVVSYKFANSFIRHRIFSLVV
jgi:hypothetical protein